MKKIICVVLAILLCCMTTCCLAENNGYSRFEPAAMSTYYICRPNVKCRNMENPEEFVTLHFGEKVTVKMVNEEYTDIVYGDGEKGYVITGFIVETSYPMIYIAKDAQQYLSPFPLMTPSDFGYGACGLRWDERALILFEIGNYYFIVTEEGFSGYIEANSPYISIYEGE